MSDPAAFDGSVSRRAYKAPYSSRHPVPKIQDYEETVRSREKDATQEHHNVDDHHTNTFSTAISAAKRHIVHRHTEGRPQSNRQEQPYPCANRNHESTNQEGHDHGLPSPVRERETPPSPRTRQDSTEATMSDSGGTPSKTEKSTQPPKEDQQGREVTDPITHLPIVIHDSTSPELESVPENENPAGRASHSEQNERTMQGRQHQQIAHDEMEALFPPPSFEAIGERLAGMLKTAITAGLSFVLIVSLLVSGCSHLYYGRGWMEQEDKQAHDSSHPVLITTTLLLMQAVLSLPLIVGIRAWVEKRAISMWEDKTWENHDGRNSTNPMPESVQWLNSLLTSVWPLVNPDVRQLSELFYPENFVLKIMSRVSRARHVIGLRIS